MNRVLLVGRVTKPPVFGRAASGSPYIKFDIEVLETWRDKEGVDKIRREFIRISQWGKSAELAQEKVKINHLVSVEGSMMSHSFEDEDGKKQISTEVKADKIESLERGEHDRK